MKIINTFIVLTFLWSNVYSDDLLEPFMDDEEYQLFVDQISEAVSIHPEYLSSLDSLRAAGANLKSSKANLLPQVRFIIDSKNQLDKVLRTAQIIYLKNLALIIKLMQPLPSVNFFMTLVRQKTIFLNLKLCLTQREQSFLQL